MKNGRNRCIALAGLFQSVTLADCIARTGNADADASLTSIRSLMALDAPSVEGVYGGLAGLGSGLHVLRGYLTLDESHQLLRMIMLLLHLDRKLAKRADLTEVLRQGITATSQRLEHFPMLHANILAQLADLYVNSISTMTPRIMVQGEPLHLQNPDNANRIRALLLAGIRSARLFHQNGGGRLQLLMRRRAYLEEVDRLLDE